METKEETKRALERWWVDVLGTGSSRKIDYKLNDLSIDLIQVNKEKPR